MEKRWSKYSTYYLIKYVCNIFFIYQDTDTKVNCRWDHHQTGSFVIVSIYAKQYSPSKSVIKLNPIRLYASLVFPQQNNATFELDAELKGVCT